jgi:hypothetical protein
VTDPDRRLEERRLEQEARDEFAAGKPASDDTVNLPSWLADELFEIVQRGAKSEAGRERWAELERRYRR